MERISGKTISDIKSGQKFFSMFFKCNKLIANNGIIIIEKKWICNSPNKITKNIVEMAVTDNTVRVNLFNFIFCKYNKPPRIGINPIYCKIGIIEKLGHVSKLKRLSGTVLSSV